MRIFHKALLLFVLMAIGAGGTASAQRGYFAKVRGKGHGESWQRDAQKNYFGLRLGVNASQLHTQGIKDIARNSKGGLSAGAVVGWRLLGINHLYLESGILYTGKGANFKGAGYVEDNMVDNEEEEMRMNYFEIPVVIKGKIGTPIKKLTIDPYAGAFFSIGIGGKMRYMLSQKETSSFRSDAFRRGDAGLRLGCGLNYGVLYFDMSYDVGLVNVAKDEMKDFNYNDFSDRIRTGALNFSIGLDF